MHFSFQPPDQKAKYAQLKNVNNSLQSVSIHYLLPSLIILLPPFYNHPFHFLCLPFLAPFFLFACLYSHIHPFLFFPIFFLCTPFLFLSTSLYSHIPPMCTSLPPTCISQVLANSPPPPFPPHLSHLSYLPFLPSFLSLH